MAAKENNAIRQVLFTYYYIREVTNMKDTYLTVEDIAAKFKVSYDTALGFVKYSGVESVKLGRQYRVLESKLDEFLYPPQKPKIKMMHRPVYQIVERK